MNERQEANRRILARLGALNETLTDQRFGQLLVNAGVTHNRVDQIANTEFTVNEIKYNEESTSILDRVQKI